MKHLGVNSRKHEWDLYVENYKGLTEYLSKWKTQHRKELTFPRLVYGFNTKSQKGFFFKRYRQNYSKLDMEWQRKWNNFKKKV